MIETVVVMDKDDPNIVYGILEVTDHTASAVEESFKDTMNAYGDEWCVEDLIKNLPEDWTYTWTETNVSAVGV